MTEKTTDLIISKLLDASSIEHYAESCPIEEINKAMVSGNSQPNWDYMEAYMQNLEQQQILEYLRHIER